MIDGELVSFRIAVIRIDFRLLLPQSDVLRDVKDFVTEVLPENGPHFHIVFRQLFRKALRFVQQFAVLLQNPRKEFALRDRSQEIGFESGEFNHILFGVENHAYFIALFVGSAVVNVGEADVLRAGVDAADVGVSVFVDGFEPSEVFGEENVGFDEDASSFVEDVEHDQSSAYGFEVVFEIALRFRPHSLLQFAERLFDFEDAVVRKVRFEVASVHNRHLKQG